MPAETGSGEGRSVAAMKKSVKKVGNGRKKVEGRGNSFPLTSEVAQCAIHGSTKHAPIAMMRGQSRFRWVSSECSRARRHFLTSLPKKAPAWGHRSLSENCYVTQRV